MKKFIIKIFFFITSFAAFLLVPDFIITKGLQKAKSQDYKEWNEIYSGNIDANIVINGSSRAWVHVSPYILDSILITNSYNLGIDGYNFHMQYCKYREYMQFNTGPELVIQTLDITTLQKRTDLYNLNQFLPYIYKSRIREFTRQYKGFSFFDYYIPFYRYHNLSEIINTGFKEFFGNTGLDNGKFKGYLGMNSEWNGTFDEYKKANLNGVKIDLHSESIELMDTFLSECKKESINVILVYPPEFIENQYLTKNRTEIINLYSKFAEKYKLVFLDYSNNDLSYKKELFYNSQHLNKKGAELFTKILADDIKLRNINYHSKR